jgi:hypothetical protein
MVAIAYLKIDNLMLYMKNILSDLCKTFIQFFSRDGLVWKSIVALLMYFADIHLYVIAVLSLTAIDVFMGVWAARRRNEQITSRKLRKGLIEKAALYLVLLVASFILGKVMQNVLSFEKFYLTWILTLLISVYEITSIIENMISINPNLSFLGKFKKLLNSIADKQIESTESSLSSQETNPDKN